MGGRAGGFRVVGCGSFEPNGIHVGDKPLNSDVSLSASRKELLAKPMNKAQEINRVKQSECKSYGCS